MKTSIGIIAIHHIHYQLYFISVDAYFNFSQLCDNIIINKLTSNLLQIHYNV